MVDGCTLSNSLLVGVHNIPKARLLLELDMRRIPIPTKSRAAEHSYPIRMGPATVGADVAKYVRVRGRGEQVLHRGTVSSFRADNDGGLYTIHYVDGGREVMDSLEFQLAFNLANDELYCEKAYVLSLRDILVGRLKEEEEYERLIMYARDVRFDRDVDRPKWEHGRIIVCMLHCLMRMNEKVLFLLYFAAMKRTPDGSSVRHNILDDMTAKIRCIGNISGKWHHTLDKDKHGNEKLLPFKMNYDKSKKIFNFKALTGLYELIDLAIVSESENLSWRAFIVSYLNCMELLTLSREYKPDEIDKLDLLCKKMYHLLVTTIGGLESITNYFHVIGSGHVVWMVRRYGNMWRYRNEGVEAFNAIVSLRHNKNNKKGGYKKTRKGDPIRKCAEFWSLGQWLGRWSLWQLGYGDTMHQPTDDMWIPCPDETVPCCNSDTDDSYNPLENVDDESSSGTSSDEDSHVSGSPDVMIDNDVEDEHWNGLWYAISDDYESTSDDNDCESTDEDGTSERSDTVGESSCDTDASDGDEHEDMFPLSAPCNMLSRDCRGQNLYGRACQTLSHVCSRQQRFENAVHAAS